MKFSRLFTGKPYHEIEKNADALFKRGEYGFAKLEYEKALLKLAKKTPEAPETGDLIEAKIVKCKDALALEHKKAAENLTEAGIHDEAEDLLQLALELVQDEQLAVEIEEQLKSVKTRSIHYLDYLDSHGQDEAIALALAKTFEALGSKEKARKQYGNEDEARRFSSFAEQSAQELSR